MPRNQYVLIEDRHKLFYSLQSIKIVETQTKETSTYDILKQIDLLIDESLQVYELENEKTNAINDLFASLRVVTQFLGFTINVHHGLFGLKSDSEILLTPNLDLIFVYPNNKSEVKRLDSYPPETIVQCLDYIIPQLVEYVRREKISLTEKMEFLRSVSKRIQQVRTLTDSNRNPQTGEQEPSRT